MFVIRFARLWLLIGLGFVVASLVSLAIFGLSFGSDFVGGSVVEFRIVNTDPTSSEVKEVLIDDEATDFVPRSVTKTDTSTYRAEFPPFASDQEFEQVLEIIRTEYDTEDISKADVVERLSTGTISPVVGQELRNRSLIAIGVVLIGIVIFITYVFRGVSHPVPSFYYGLSATVALFHDIVIPIGIFAVLSHFEIVQIDLLFIIALLSILGSSVNDTIVVFDRVRENLREIGGHRFEEVVGKSVSQTLARSMNTSLTLLVVLGSIFLFGGQSVQFFALALFLGILFGTYSSIFIASPILVLIYQMRFKKNN